MILSLFCLGNLMRISTTKCERFAHYVMSNCLRLRVFQWHPVNAVNVNNYMSKAHIWPTYNRMLCLLSCVAFVVMQSQETRCQSYSIAANNARKSDQKALSCMNHASHRQGVRVGDQHYLYKSWQDCYCPLSLQLHCWNHFHVKYVRTPRRTK